jgi:ADP-heptose:LPS heptosyltransferase
MLRALGLGDLLTALPALRGLADAFGGHRRVLVAPAALWPLARWSGAVDELADLDLKTAGSWPVSPPAALRGADLAVNLHGRGPESTHLLLAGRPRRLAAFRCPELPETAAWPAWNESEHEVDRWCRLVAAAGATPDPRRLELAVPAGGPADAPDDAAREAARGATLLHPGAASSARRWPAERWAAVARAERLAGRRVVVTGSARERPLVEAVARDAGLPAAAVLAGRLGLTGLARAVAVAARVVCGDTGVGHLATAVGTPSVLLFGPTPPSRWGPPADRPWHRVLWAGSVGDPHADTPHPGLLRIGVADVVGTLAALDGAAPDGAAPDDPTAVAGPRWAAPRLPEDAGRC